MVPPALGERRTLKCFCYIYYSILPFKVLKLFTNVALSLYYNVSRLKSNKKLILFVFPQIKLSWLPFSNFTEPPLKRFKPTIFIPFFSYKTSKIQQFEKKILTQFLLKSKTQPAVIAGFVYSAGSDRIRLELDASGRSLAMPVFFSNWLSDNDYWHNFFEGGSCDFRAAHYCIFRVTFLPSPKLTKWQKEKKFWWQ